MNYDFSQPNKLSKKALWLALSKAFWANFKIFWGMYALVLFRNYKNPDDRLEAILVFSGVFLLISIFIFVFQYIKFTYFSYKIIDNELIIQKGWLRKYQTIVKFEKIYEVNLTQNFVHKLVGLYKIEIDTAGSEGIEISIDGVDYDKSLVIKNILINKETIFEDKQSTILEEIPTAEKDFSSLKVSVLTLIKIGLTRKYLQTLGLMFAFSFQVVDFVKYFYGKDDFYEDFGSYSEVNFAGIFWIFVLFLLLIFVILFNLIRTLLIYYGYKLEIINNRFTASYGSFSSNFVAVPSAKVQMFRFEQNYFQRLMDLFEVNILQIESREKNEKGRRGLVIPGVNELELNKLFEFIYAKNRVLPADFFRPNLRRVFVRIAYWLFIFLLVFSGAYFFEMTSVMLISSLIFLMISLLIYVAYRNEKLFLVEDFIILKQGIWDIQTTYLQIDKVQQVKVKQSYFQKNKNLASLQLCTASENLNLDFYDQSLVKNLANQVLYEVEFFSKNQ